jgi:hypothetical protein
MEIEVNYYYDMFDIYGEKVTIYVFNDGMVEIEYYNYDLFKMEYKEFENETAVYNWAYKRGYRE